MSRPAVHGARVDRLAVSRRELLAVAGAIIGTLAVPDAASAVGPVLDVDAFQTVSRALTGYSPANRGLAAALREAFADELEKLTRLRDILEATPTGDWTRAIADAGLADLAEALIDAWYTGIVGAGDEQRVVTYLDAFVWYAVGYTKPPSRCDTGFGAWADRPPGEY